MKPKSQYGPLPDAFQRRQGRQPVAIEGAFPQRHEQHSFPKVFPDGRWDRLCEEPQAQLMRPDSQLYIVPRKASQQGVCVAIRR